MDPIGAGLGGLGLGALLAGLAWRLDPPAQRANHMLLAAGVIFVLAAITALFGWQFDALADSCVGGLECIGPSIANGIRAGIAWSAAIGLGAAGIAATCLAFATRTRARSSA